MNTTTDSAAVIPFFLTPEVISDRRMLDDFGYFVTNGQLNRFVYIDLVPSDEAGVYYELSVDIGQWSSWDSKQGTLRLYNESWTPSRIRVINFDKEKTLMYQRSILLFREDEFKFLFLHSFDEIRSGINRGDSIMQIIYMRLMQVNAFLKTKRRCDILLIQFIHNLQRNMNASMILNP